MMYKLFLTEKYTIIFICCYFSKIRFKNMTIYGDPFNAGLHEAVNKPSDDVTGLVMKSFITHIDVCVSH